MFTGPLSTCLKFSYYWNLQMFLESLWLLVLMYVKKSCWSNVKSPLIYVLLISVCLLMRKFRCVFSYCSTNTNIKLYLSPPTKSTTLRLCLWLLIKALWKNEATVCDWMSHIFFSRISLYDDADNIKAFWNGNASISKSS